VGSSFKVKVSNYQGPVGGLLVKITSLDNHLNQSAVTDGSGVAQFRDIPKGTWYLDADHDNGFGLELDIKANGPTNMVVPMRWPSTEPIHVHSLAGTMRAPGSQLDQPALPLELLERVSGRVVSTLETSNRGEFDFGKRVPGLYFIRLKAYSFGNQQQVGGLISIAVDPTARGIADNLDLNLVWTSCGLTYTDQSQCRYPDLHVNTLAGHVSDSLARPVYLGAQIILLDAAQNQVVHATPDQSGNFSFPGPLMGTYQLRVEGAAFTPVHTPLHIEPTARSSSLEIETASFSCGTVRAK
jgi:hypothetical protein